MHSIISGALSAELTILAHDLYRKGSTSYKNGKLKLGDLLHISVFPICYLPHALTDLFSDGLEVGIDARIAELPKISKMSAPEPTDDAHHQANFSILPKVVAKFKPPVKADARLYAAPMKENETMHNKSGNNHDSPIQPISVESFYGSSRKGQQL